LFSIRIIKLIDGQRGRWTFSPHLLPGKRLIDGGIFEWCSMEKSNAHSKAYIAKLLSLEDSIKNGCIYVGYGHIDRKSKKKGRSGIAKFSGLKQAVK